MSHNHSHATHVLNCPICARPIGIHAHDEQQALQKMIHARDYHFKAAKHVEDETTTDEEIEKSIRESIQKVQ